MANPRRTRSTGSPDKYGAFVVLPDGPDGTGAVNTMADTPLSVVDQWWWRVKRFRFELLLTIDPSRSRTGATETTLVFDLDRFSDTGPTTNEEQLMHAGAHDAFLGSYNLVAHLFKAAQDPFFPAPSDPEYDAFNFIGWTVNFSFLRGGYAVPPVSTEGFIRPSMALEIILTDSDDTHFLQTLPASLALSQSVFLATEANMISQAREEYGMTTIYMGSPNPSLLFGTPRITVTPLEWFTYDGIFDPATGAVIPGQDPVTAPR